MPNPPEPPAAAPRPNPAPADTGSPDTGPPDTEVSREAWLALAVTTLVTFLVVVDISAVTVSFPSIQRDFDVSRAELSWVISGYNIVVGALLLVSGRIADSIGRRRVFLPGVAIFMVASLAAGLSQSVGMLIAARLVQGVGGAIIVATSFAVMLPGFPVARRSTAIGLAGATGSLGAVAGPALGSFLIDLYSWRAIFLLNVPLSLLVLFLGPRFLQESSDPEATGKIDYAGVALGTASVALVMGAIVQSESWGISDPRVFAMVLVGLALLPVVISRSKTHPEPLINLDLFSYQSFRATSIGVVFYGFAFTAGFLVSSLLLQDLWGQSIRATGLALVPGPLIAAVISPLTGSFADRYGHRGVLAFGSLLCGAGYLSYVFVLDESPAVGNLYVPISLVIGVGIGLTVATWSSAALSDIPQSRFGVAGATYNTFRQASYALGISISIALVSSGANEFDITGYRRAWIWVAVCYLLSAATIWFTFPAGSSSDRAASLDRTD